MFFRRHVQKAIPTTNSTVSSSIPITTTLDTINLADDEHESTENELSTTPTTVSTMEKSVTFSNDIDIQSPIISTTTSTIEHLSTKHPGLLRLFDSTVCTVSIIISYLFSSKEPIVQQFLGKKLFDYSHDELDFYLPQLINMYIHIPSISNVIHDYITTRYGINRHQLIRYISFFSL